MRLQRDELPFMVPNRRPGWGVAQRPSSATIHNQRDDLTNRFLF
jgi:hypothetical protein